MRKEGAIIRYCSRCKTNVPFFDSKKTRTNANGKNLFIYAIYKCEKDHTWNRKIRMKKAS